MNKNKEQELETKEILDIYATKQELNVEATIRAESDQTIIDEFTILRRTQNNKIIEIESKVEKEQEELNNLEAKVSEQEDKITNNQEKITTIKECFFERIKELENQNEHLNSQLEDADKIILEKDNEILKLTKEMEENGARNDINLRFTNIPEFTITKAIFVKEFINEHLKALIIPRMKIRYPEAEFNKDYSITLAGLTYNDLVQGKDITVFIKAIDEGKLIGKSAFMIKINYNFDSLEQGRFVEEFLQSAIPVSLRNIPENAAPNYNVPNEIINTKPLKLLLYNKNFKHLTFKIFSEMNAATYWTDFHRPWQFSRDGYSGTGQSVIGASGIINNINNLYYATSGYYHNIFKLIEERINDSGVNCTITKKWVRTANTDRVLHNLGNLTFNVANINLENEDIVVTQSRHYYIMINFELDLKGIKKFYRGVTLAFSDNLELY